MSGGAWPSVTYRRGNPIVHTCSFRELSLS